MKRVEKYARKKGFPVVLLVAVICVLGLLAYSGPQIISFAGGLGTVTGTMVGRGIGSARGLTEGQIEGTKSGRNAGINADDTIVTIENSMHQIENLEVLVATVKVTDVVTVGSDGKVITDEGNEQEGINSKDVKYKAALTMRGDLVFTVDMSKADITQDGDDLRITLPAIEHKFNIDNDSIEIIQEYQKKFFDGDAETGIKTYLETMSNIQSKTAEELDNYNSLHSQAVEAAKDEVERLAKSASVYNGSIYVDVKDGE